MSKENNVIIPETNENALAPVTPVNVIANTNQFNDEGFNLITDITTAKLSYCSMTADTDEEKATLFNSMNNPDERLKEHINKVISIKDIYIEVVNCTNTETGEVTACPRIVLIDSKGTSYQCVSIGIYSAIKKIIQIFGEPSTWSKPVNVEVKQILKADRAMLTLNIVA